MIKGSGGIDIDNIHREISRGMLILVPKTKSHGLNTWDEEMSILTISVMSDPIKGLSVEFTK